MSGQSYQKDTATGNLLEQLSTNRAAHSVPISDPNGNYPANNFTDLNPAPTAAAAAFTITGLQGMHSGQFAFTLTTETILLEALDSSGNNIGPILVEAVNVGTAGTVIAATALTVGTWKIRPPWAGAAIRCTKSAAVNTLTFNGFMSGAA